MSKPEDRWTYPRCTLIRVQDGDTVQLTIDCGLSTYRRIWVRLAHINSPELKHADGERAKIRLLDLLEVGPLTVTTTKDKTEKFGRMLAEIVNGHGVNVGDQLVAEGLARPYEGGRR